MPIETHYPEPKRGRFNTLQEVQEFLRLYSKLGSRIFIDSNDILFVSYKSHAIGGYRLLKASWTLDTDQPTYPVDLAPKGSFIITTENGEGS